MAVQLRRPPRRPACALRVGRVVVCPRPPYGGRYPPVGRARGRLSLLCTGHRAVTRALSAECVDCVQGRETAIIYAFCGFRGEGRRHIRACRFSLLGGSVVHLVFRRGYLCQVSNFGVDWCCMLAQSFVERTSLSEVEGSRFSYPMTARKYLEVFFPPTLRRSCVLCIDCCGLRPFFL